MNLDVNTIKNNINDYIESMKRNDFYSLDVLMAKLNNYCIGVKEELKYKVYESLNENGYSVDEIEENENAIDQELKLLQLEFNEKDNNDYQLKFKIIINNFEKNLDKYVDYKIESEKRRSIRSNYSNEYNDYIRKLNTRFIADYNLFKDDFLKLKKLERLEISIKDIAPLINNIIKSDIRDIKKVKRDLKRELERIDINIEKILKDKSKLLIIENTKYYLTHVVNIHAKIIRNLSSKSIECSVEKSNEEINDNENIDNNNFKNTEFEDFNIVNDISNREINNKKSGSKIDRYGSIRPLDINNKIVETESVYVKEQESKLINDKIEFKSNNYGYHSSDISEQIHRHNANNPIENLEYMNSISIENITIKTSNNKIFYLKELLDEDDQEIYEEIKQKVLFLIEKQNI